MRTQLLLIILSTIITLLSLQVAFAQQESVKIDMQKENWIVPKGAVFETFDNRETLLLKGKRATVKDMLFINGTIEVDVYANSKRSFAGITFRKQNETMEEVYLRMHKSSQVDAVQYTPIFNGESNWQLYREYQAQVTFMNKGWNTLKIEVKNKTASVFVNDKKVMDVDDLRTDQNNGSIGLFALFSNRFSNFRITHKPAIVEDTKTDNETPVDSNIISTWEVTKAMPFKAGEIQFSDFLKEDYTELKTEASGLLPISKYITKTSSGNFEQNAEDYVVASTTIYANEGDTKLFSFDYSDKIIVYLNGAPIFKGNNAFRAKGVQYMGHVDIDANKLYLRLKKGENRIHCVVIDKANGWGLMGKLE